MGDKVKAFPAIPSVTELLKKEEIQEKVEECGHHFVVKSIREVLGDVRKRVTSGKGDAFRFDETEFMESFHKALKRNYETRYPRAINATGIVLHTNLGRAVFPAKVMEAINRSFSGYSVLQVSRHTGKRNRRDEKIEELLCELTGAEAATVVNNNAAATMLILNTVGEGRNIICSRGQMIEIGGSFRIPEVMEMSGARLKEVGATNKTHLRDYENAIDEETAALLLVHTSNYKIIGFAEEVEIEDLVKLGRKHDLPVIHDMGSGALVSLKKFGMKDDEPLIADTVKAGADLACFSMDKLIGGAQGGAIVGRKDLVRKIRKNPLARALRVDKVQLIAFEETLKLFFDPDRLQETHPAYRMITEPLDRLRGRARRMAKKAEKAGVPFDVKVEKDYSQLGSGSLPGKDIETWVVALYNEDSAGLNEIACKLRMYDPPVFTRVGKGKIICDMRTLLPGEDTTITNALVELFGKKDDE